MRHAAALSGVASQFETYTQPLRSARHEEDERCWEHYSYGESQDERAQRLARRAYQLALYAFEEMQKPDADAEIEEFTAQL